MTTALIIAALAAGAALIVIGIRVECRRLTSFVRGCRRDFSRW